MIGLGLFALVVIAVLIAALGEPEVAREGWPVLVACLLLILAAVVQLFLPDDPSEQP